MLKVLAIDDTAANLELVKEMLLSQDFEVITASDGQSGLEKAMEHQPDLIICDIEMPQMDGYHVLETLRKNERFQHTPFVFLTGVNTQESIDRGLDLGADNYLLKPFTLKKLISTVTTSFKKAQTLKDSFEQRSVAAEESYKNLQTHDAVTGLLNTTTLAANFIDISGLLFDQSLAVLSISVDQLNEYFDQSPSLGQVITKYVANKLKRVFGKEEKYLYYAGHHTFLAFVPFMQHNSKLIQNIATLFDAISEPLRIGSYDIQLSLHIGISIFGADGYELGELTKKAHQARVQAIKDEGQRYKFYA